MGKTSYRNINELIKELNENIHRLNEGSLSIEEIETLVERSKELYERLIVLRYKAYENFGTPQEKSTEEIFDEQPGEAVETPFDFTGVSEEESKEPVEVVAEKVEEDKIEEPLADQPEKEEAEGNIQPGFDFTESEENKDIVDTTSTPEEEKEITLKDKIATEEVPLHEKLKEKADESSLRKQLQSKPVSDIRSEISIARRFEYISCMFNGDNDAYDKAINILNSCENAEDARSKLTEYSTDFNWDLENKAIIKFVELVERRYMS